MTVFPTALTKEGIQEVRKELDKTLPNEIVDQVINTIKKHSVPVETAEPIQQRVPLIQVAIILDKDFKKIRELIENNELEIRQEGTFKYVPIESLEKYIERRNKKTREALDALLAFSDDVESD